MIDTKMPVPMSLRTLVSEQQYQEAKRIGDIMPLTEEPSIHQWEHWRLIANRFPYTVAFTTHRMLVPKRTLADLNELTLDEFKELLDILSGHVNDEYDLWFVNTHKRRSVLNQFHIHVATYVLDRKDMKL